MIWWIASYPKSGNTWLRMFLAAYKNGGQVDINGITPWSYDDMGGQLYETLSPCPTENLGPAEFAALRLSYLTHINRGGDSKSDPKETRVFIKTHNCRADYFEMPLIPQFLTEGAFYLVRDPRDVAVSYAHYSGKSIDDTIDVMEHSGATAVMDYRHHVLSSWSNHVRSWRDANIRNLHVIRYEDMLQQPGETFRLVVEALGLPVDEDILWAAIEATSFGALQQQEANNGFRERAKSSAVFFRQGQARGWRAVLTSEQVRRIERAHNDMMESFDYGRYDETERAPRPNRHPGQDRQGFWDDPIQKRRQRHG